MVTLRLAHFDIWDENLVIIHAGFVWKLHSWTFSRGQNEKFEDRLRTIVWGRGRGRGQIFEAEAKDKILASRPAWPRGLNITVFHCWQTVWFWVMTTVKWGHQCWRVRKQMWLSNRNLSVDLRGGEETKPLDNVQNQHIVSVSYHHLSSLSVNCGDKEERGNSLSHMLLSVSKRRRLGLVPLLVTLRLRNSHAARGIRRVTHCRTVLCQVLWCAVMLIREYSVELINQVVKHQWKWRVTWHS